MHARVSFYDAQTRADDAIKAFEQVTGPIEEMEGNRGGMLLIDRGSGKAITITFWDTEEDLNTSVARANQLRQQAADSGGLTVRSVEHYEVGMEFGR